MTSQPGRSMCRPVASMPRHGGPVCVLVPRQRIVAAPSWPRTSSTSIRQSGTERNSSAKNAAMPSGPRTVTSSAWKRTTTSPAQYQPGSDRSRSSNRRAKIARARSSVAAAVVEALIRASLAAEHAAGGGVARLALPRLHLHVAARDDAGAERHVAAHDEALGAGERRRPGGEAALEVRDRLEVRGVELDERLVAVAHHTRVLVEPVDVRAQHEQVVGRLDRREP